MVGRSGLSVTESNPTGIMQLAGERWSTKLAEGVDRIVVDERVEVVGTEGLKVVVKKV
ncbi:MAG TPA: hypothetical protein DIW44_15415 [Anaerolineaceae bacterium]|nr:hypothetical protein [Anaerolineaceae bacterium]